MPNHIHLVAVRREEPDFAVDLRRTHGRCARDFPAWQQRSGEVSGELIGHVDGTSGLGR